MRRWILLCCYLLAGSVSAADPNEGPILKFMSAWFPAASDAVVTLEPKDSGSGFAVYYAYQTPKDKKRGEQQPLVYLPSSRRIIVGDYFNLIKFKGQEMDPKFIAAFLSNAVGASFKGAEPVPKPDLPQIDLFQETGYGRIRLQAFLFGKVHLIVGKAHPVDADPRELRLKEINPALGGRLGDARAPRHLHVFLDLECPHCARLEKELLPLLKEKKDWQAVFFQFPLTLGHPIAFKAAAAAHCFRAEDPALYFDFMEWFYPQRGDVDISSIDSLCYGYAQMHGLDEKFLGCYMQEENLRSVLDTIQMGTDAEVRYTPAIYVDGTSYSPENLMALLKPPAETAAPPASPKPETKE